MQVAMVRASKSAYVKLGEKTDRVTVPAFPVNLIAAIP